jgi:AraC-like DNA-binding protein
LKKFYKHHDACQVAASLALSERTLQRRLAEEGTSYLKVTEYFYGNLALQYLQQSTLTVTETATVLEYADQHSFSKAFRKWYGITPATVRRLRKANAGAALPAT